MIVNKDIGAILTSDELHGVRNLLVEKQNDFKEIDDFYDWLEKQDLLNIYKSIN